MAEYQFAIRCRSCGSTLRLGQQDLGTERACPRCKTLLKVPREVDARQQAQAEEAKHEFSFLCKLCGTRMYGRPSQIGKGLSCPDCETLNVVPTPQKPAAKKVPQNDGDEYELAPIEERPPPTTVAPSAEPAGTYRIRLMCSYCDSMLYADSRQIGQQVDCPDCHAKVTVRDVPPPKPKRQVRLEDQPDIAFAPAAERPQEASNAESLMSSAMEHVVEKEKDRPVPPKRPFAFDVYLFPFTSAHVVIYGVMLAAFMSICNLCFQEAARSSGLGMIIGVFMGVTGVFFAALSLVVAGYVATNVVTWAAMGYQKIIEWPGFDVFDWLKRTLFLFNGFAVSSAPGALVAYMIPGGNWRAIFPLVSTFALFPLVMLSMVSEASPFVPFSGFIFASLNRVRSGWLKFYAHAACLLGLVYVLWAIGNFLQIETMYLIIGVTVYSLLVYFRVMGRLAYIIDEEMAGFDDAPEDDEDDLPQAPSSQADLEQGAEPPPLAGDPS